ncbi:MAG: 2-oxoacid ferredoxin oxidoreductase [Thermoplasmata archaeon]|uniref:2-oxoacid ferredoxin oxidoreductase n=1 Tax=Candidatus Sysuiplasma superficiale TaxID=2823368 RepID=A0A8J8CC70_9ARCH|nr:2-oxoacid ferredoxin oxidoreductase [Candidatus Sysuiplasma superficiale]MBX8644359.1 2-oxoacid ferredoxin oxidoreductase [Candidatus Sysuiplasma superficiale]MCL4346999.1 thiamine pyrophosphate-dependent enzyme [Candidatus Thermoplasmatota archaeon]
MIGEQLFDMKLYESDIRPDWCPGCGDFGALSAVKGALAGLKIEPHNVLISSGIGCSSNFPGYIRTYGHHGLHGRPVPVAVGAKIANPALTVIAIAGDGDEYGIGFNHVVHAARRNHDIKLIVLNNEIYGLTTGQLSPTSRFGQKTKTTPFGSSIFPLNPLSSLLGIGATFVARGFSGQVKPLTRMIQEAIKHRGFALVDVLSPCVTWNDLYDDIRARMYDLDSVKHDPSDYHSAMTRALEQDKIPLGIFYRREDLPSFDELLRETTGNSIPVKEVRRFNDIERKAALSMFD